MSGENLRIRGDLMARDWDPPKVPVLTRLLVGVGYVWDLSWAAEQNTYLWPLHVISLWAGVGFLTA